MRMTIFGRERTTRDGKKFPAFSSRLVDKTTGEEIAVTVKFPSNVTAPALSNCPCNIVIPKGKSSYKEREIEKIGKDGRPIFDEVTGEKVFIVSRTVWVREWKMSEIPYEDSTMDRFEGGTDEEDF